MNIKKHTWMNIYGIALFLFPVILWVILASRQYLSNAAILVMISITGIAFMASLTVLAAAKEEKHIYDMEKKWEEEDKEERQTY